MNYLHVRFSSYLLLCVDPNPCAEDSGGCSHLCLLSAVAADGYTCTCPDDSVLDVHGRNCSGTYKYTVWEFYVCALLAIINMLHTSRHSVACHGCTHLGIHLMRLWC